MGAADEPEILQGGVANAGAVIRRGDRVERPAPINADTLHALLRHLRAHGFDGAPEPIEISQDGREYLRFIPGDVPTVPFPRWSQTDAVLASTTALLRRFHDATVGFVAPADAQWNIELADPSGRRDDPPVIAHNDVCPENVVYRAGVAVALLDFEYAAPGRRVYDLATLARMIVPIEADQDAARLGRGGLDPYRRLRVAADGYGLEPDRFELVDALATQIETGGAFVQRRVDAGDEAFTRMWNQSGGRERFDRRRVWFAAHRQRFLDAVG